MASGAVSVRPGPGQWQPLPCRSASGAGAGEIAHHFTIIVPSQAAPDEAALATLHRLVEAQKPAHTRYQLRVAAPELRIGCQSTVGVDTLLGHYPARRPWTR
jgi:hypothetical protein